ncbi:MAG: hypothetical protein K2K98_06105 [Muribaculaceae bacterium]|nr:hypothetical protein [Muribaculaceae bacterium]
MKIPKSLIYYMIAASVAVISGLPMHAESAPPAYTLNLSSGKLPKDVETANTNGLLPKKSAYKRGYTEKGWTVDRLYNLGYVAVTPTYTAGEGNCENTLTLPPLKIENGHRLIWKAQSVYRHFPESYRVEAVPTDGSNPVTLAEVEAESYSATAHNIPLTPVEGKEVSLRFVCTSSEGYLLAMWDVQVGEFTDEVSTEEAFTAGSSGDPFMRKFLVDRGTGMWCVNCPAGDIAVDRLMELYGDRVVSLNTHVRDALGNQAYWDKLDWYAVPYMMLNRIKGSAGPNTNKFSQYYEQPTSFAIRIDEIPAPQGRTLEITAHVSVNETIDNSDGRYRLGYVLTGDYHDPTNPEFIQSNNCNQPSYGPYYYLPSSIHPELMYYEDVTLTTEGAFDGIEGSLPTSMETGKDYEVRWQAEVPELLSNPAEARVVAYVLDTTTGEVQNTDALRVGEHPTGGVSDIRQDETSCILGATREGVRVRIAAGKEYRLDIYDVAGSLIGSHRGISHGQEVLPYQIPPGIYFITLSTAQTHASVKAAVR